MKRKTQKRLTEINESNIVFVANKLPNVLQLQGKKMMCVNVDSPVLQQVIFDGDPSCYTAAYVDHFMNIVTRKLIILFAPNYSSQGSANLSSFI